MKGKTIKVVVGSENPVKINAAKKAFNKLFGKVEIMGIKVDSEVGEQPFSNEMTLIGAINRAKNAMKKVTNADYWVGIEGGLYVTSVGVFVNGWVAVTNGTKFGYGSTISVQIPKSVVKMLESSEVMELEEGIERISGIPKPGEKMGAIGVLTNNLIDREEAFIQAIFAAMAPFITRYYE